MKTSRILLFIALFLFTACRPDVEEPILDCNETPNHVDCVEDPVDCAITPDHEDCTEEPIDCTVTPNHEDCVEEPVECTDTQVEVDNECIDLTGAQIQLRHVLSTMSDVDNVHINVTITEPDDTTHLVELAFDGSTSMYRTDAETIYHTSVADTCELTTIKWNQTETTTVECTERAPMFYQSFTYDMFSLSGGKFLLDSDHTEIVTTIIDEWLPGASFESLSMQIGTDTIGSIELSLTINDDPYVLLYQFDQYDGVTLTIPSE